MALRIRIRIERRRPPLERLFSFSSSEGNSSGNNNNSSKGASSDPQPSSISSHFRDVKARLKQQQQQPPDGHLLRRTPQPPPPPTYYNRPPQQREPPPRNSTESLEEIRTRLSEFRRRSAPPPPSSPSFQEIYQRNSAFAGRENESVPPNAAKISLDKIRESLRGISDRGNANAANGPGLSGGGGGDRMSLSKFTASLRLRPVEGDDTASSKSAGGVGKGGSLPLAIFGREIREKNEAKGGKESDSLARTQLLRSYDYEELGEKLRNLRDVDGGKKGFSLEELNERLASLQEMEEKEMESRSQKNNWSDLREALSQIKISEDEKSKKNTLHRLDLLGTLCGTPGYMHHPPKEHLVEKYFHPDNMSSAEKLKIQLAKVRDEFKMSESDCGSARVQVALLTTKIKHLSSVLHKKDKHSRKGLEGMVQRRKRLLKYLRNTDWDSYTMILARLGLRDNTELRR